MLQLVARSVGSLAPRWSSIKLVGPIEFVDSSLLDHHSTMVKRV